MTPSPQWLLTLRRRTFTLDMDGQDCLLAGSRLVDKIKKHPDFPGDNVLDVAVGLTEPDGPG